MATLANLVVKVGADLVEFERGIQKAERQISTLSKSLDRIGSSMQTAGKVLTATVTLPILGVGAAAIKMGMDAVESENLVSVSFGNMRASADAWSKHLSASLGLNQFELRKTAGVIFNMTTSMGIGREAAFEMSTGIVQLAADMASFRNIGMDEALEKIRAGLVGEAEPLKRLGILVDETTTKTYAYKNGLAKQGEELTQQQKVLARYRVILEQTKNDQGDLARTLESPANQLRIMRTRIEEAATSLGVALMPIVQQVIAGVAALVPHIQRAVQWFTGLPQPVQMAALAAAGLAAAMGPVLYVVGGLLQSLPGLIALWKAYTAGQIAARLASIGVSTALLGVVGVIGAVAAALGGLYFISQKYGASVGKTTEELEAQVESLKKVGGQAAASRMVSIQRELAERKAAEATHGSTAANADLEAQIKGQAGALQAEIERQMKIAATTNASAEAQKRSAEAARELERAYSALMSESNNLNQMAFFEHDAKQLEFARQIKELTELQTPAGFRPLGQFEAMAEELNQLETTIQPGFSPEKFVERMALPPSALRTVFSGLGQTIRTQLGPTILQALTGGGDIGRSVGGLIGGSLANNLMSGNVGKAMSGALSGALGKTIGGAIGSIIPGLGTMLGSMVGPLLGKLGNLFKGMFGGPSQTELEGRAAGRQFTDTLRLALADTQRLEASMLAAQGNSREWAESVIAIRDAYVATGRTADQALKDHAMLIEAQGRGAEVVRRVAEQINEAFMEQQADAERLQRAIEKYGFSLEELGPSNQLRELHDQALELIEDWRVLVASGIDVSLVNEKMAGSVNAFLQTALKTGTEVPYAMKPILQLMADQGRLTDLAGNKITDLTEAGIVFSETLTQGFDRVVQKLQQLIETLQGSGVAIEDVMISADVATRLRAAEIERFIQTQPKLPFGFSDRRNQSLIDYYTNNPDIPIPMADGGMGVVTQPTLFLAGERGPEAFAFAGAGRTSFGGGGSTREGDIIVQIDTVQTNDADSFVKDLPKLVSNNRHGIRTGLRAALGVA